MATLNAEQITGFEKEQENNISRYAENEAYVLGRNPGIFKEKEKKAPDNRIPVPWAKSAVEDLTGFAASPGNRRIDFEGKLDESEADKAKREEYIEIRKSIATFNESKLETTELYNQGLTQGESYELHWVGEELDGELGIMATPEFAMVDNKEIILIWDGGIKPRLEAAIRYYVRGEFKFADVYYPELMESWKRPYKKGNRFFKVSSNSSKWLRNEEDDKVYPYTDVPLAIYKINRHSQPLFEAEKSIINANDNIISKSTNEIDRFNTLVLLVGDKADEDFVRNININKIIDGLGDGTIKWPEYLKKDMTGVAEFYKLMMDKYESEFHKNIKVPDMSDEEFAGNSSGVAMAFKLLGIENKATTIDAYFNKGLLQRNNLINQVLNSGTKKFIEYTPKIDNKRNLPVDLKSAIEIAEKLAPLVSRETLLKWLPNEIVDNVLLEIEMIDKDKPTLPVQPPVIEEEEVQKGENK